MNILEEANELIHGDRNEAYGHPLDNHDATAAMWNTYIERKFGIKIGLTGEDVCWLHIFEKGVRDANLQKRDNLTDAAGYAGNIEMIQDERKRREGR